MNTQEQTKKTNGQWYMMLPEPYRMQAINNAERDNMLGGEASSLGEIAINADNGNGIYPVVKLVKNTLSLPQTCRQWSGPGSHKGDGGRTAVFHGLQKGCDLLGGPLHNKIP